MSSRAVAPPEALIVDVRGQRAFDAGHFPGAICKSEDDPEGLCTLPRDRALYLYCT